MSTLNTYLKNSNANIDIEIVILNFGMYDKRTNSQINKKAKHIASVNQNTPAPSHFPLDQVPLYWTRKAVPLLFADFDLLSI